MQTSDNFSMLRRHSKCELFFDKRVCNKETPNKTLSAREGDRNGQTSLLSILDHLKNTYCLLRKIRKLSVGKGMRDK